MLDSPAAAAAAAETAAAIENACSPDDVPLLLDPGGPLGHLGACCEAYVSLPISAPCLSSKGVCCCSPVSAPNLLSWDGSAAAAAAGAGAATADGGSAVAAEWPGDAAESAEGAEGAGTAEEALTALQQRQQQQHMQQRRLQQQHQRELHSHFALQACAQDYQLMAADTLPVSTSKVNNSNSSSSSLICCSSSTCCSTCTCSRNS